MRARYENVVAGVGPRATPTIAEGRVFALGATGILNALDLATGRRLWSHRTVEENGGAHAHVGQERLAPRVRRPGHRERGRERKAAVPRGLRRARRRAGVGGRTRRRRATAHRSSRPSPAGYRSSSSTTPAWPDTTRRRAPCSGSSPGPRSSPTWRSPCPSAATGCSSPRATGSGSKVFAFASDDSTDLRAHLVWESPRLKSKFANLVLHDGFVYGLDDGVLTCLDPATRRAPLEGRTLRPRPAAAGGRPAARADGGRRGRAARPGARRAPRAHALPLLDGKTWNPPALAGARLLVRNDREAALYELPLAE